MQYALSYEHLSHDSIRNKLQFAIHPTHNGETFSVLASMATENIRTASQRSSHNTTLCNIIKIIFVILQQRLIDWG